jgi:Spy/CpxP family protein refolding chaperone
MNQQVTAEPKVRGRGRAVSIDAKIAEVEEQLKALKEKKRLEDKAALEKNRKAILDLFKSEGIDTVEVGSWHKAMPQIRKLLGVPAGGHGSAAASTPTSGS